MTRRVSNSLYVFTPTAGTTAYVNNGRNQMTSAGGAAVTYDANGNITADGQDHFTHDAFNRLTHTDGRHYAYDPLGRLTAMGTKELSVVDGAPTAVQNPDGTIYRRFVPGPEVSEYVGYYIGAGVTDVRWLLTDERASAIAYAHDDGAADINAYDEYGVPRGGDSGYIRYAGLFTYNDAEGLYYAQNRFYIPRHGRFLQPDPIGYDAGLNLYAYVGGDPVNRVDPTGTIACNRETGACPVTDERTDPSASPFLAGMIQSVYEDTYAWARSNPNDSITVSANVFSSSGEWSNQNISVSGSQIASALERTDVAIADNAYGIKSTAFGEIRNSTYNVASTSDLSRDVSPQDRFVSVYNGGLAAGFNKRALVSHEIGWSVLLSPQISRTWTLSPQGQAAAGRVPRLGASNQRSTGFAGQLMGRVW